MSENLWFRYGKEVSATQLNIRIKFIVLIFNNKPSWIKLCKNKSTKQWWCIHKKHICITRSLNEKNCIIEIIKRELEKFQKKLAVLLIYLVVGLTATTTCSTIISDLLRAVFHYCCVIMLKCLFLPFFWKINFQFSANKKPRKREKNCSESEDNAVKLARKKRNDSWWELCWTVEQNAENLRDRRVERQKMLTKSFEFLTAFAV